ncbi:hypothetical protein PLICRDRAFT_160784 [Plicaturopsis crispa FD-325 SS-3]|nr:hypothetical protein PLICRDRAFT_160784 [Plicaturopsis crispa FD-325 SS-3]
MDFMDFNTNASMPGGDDFRDITDVFEEATGDMEPGSMIFTDGFTLLDAMSAFEIGEPRLDSGAIIEEQEKRPPFDPLQLLLPEELCWILDRSFACEMEWHAGNTLSQTVFTVLYVHHLEDLNPELIRRAPVFGNDTSRPMELLTVVLRSFMMGLLKCCDLSWRELSKNRVNDGEDWQGEKCDVSLLEGFPVQFVLQKLDETVLWLSNSLRVTSPWREQLIVRTLLRKTLLELMDAPTNTNISTLQGRIAEAMQYLQDIRSYPPPPSPAPDSAAAFALDPYVARRLNSFLPLRVFELPPQNEVWESIEALLRGWHELSLISNTASLTTWEIFGSLRNWTPKQRQRIPYLRSCTQSAFYDGVLVLNKYTPPWIADRFLVETLGITLAQYTHCATDGWLGSGSPPITELGRQISQTMNGQVKAQWFNPPRRRRHLVKSLLEWHSIYNMCVEITDNIDPRSDRFDVLCQVPNAVLSWRLSIIREIVLSGFQLELYNPDEKALAYWYTAQVIDAHCTCLTSLLRSLPPGTQPYLEMSFQLTFLNALRIMSIAMFSILIKSMTFSWERIRLNFFRRYKWALIPEYDEIPAPVVAKPDFLQFKYACSEMPKRETYSPSGAFKRATEILINLAEYSPSGWAGGWFVDRTEFVRSLAAVSETLHAAPDSMQSAQAFDLSLLKWDPQRHPWFPTI